MLTHVTAHPEQATGALARDVNQVLANLPDEDLRRLSPALRRVPLRRRQVLLRQGQRVQDIIFPVHGLCSVTKTTEDGHSIEILSVGAEGMVSASVAWGLPDSLGDVVVQVPDDAALSMPIEVFNEELHRMGAFSVLVRAYGRLFTEELMQAGACNALHTAEQRVCRWLLTTAERIHTDTLPVTHEMLAMALGVRRPTVTLIMADLERTGLVHYGRGNVRLIDRDALVQRACACCSMLSLSRFVVSGT
jgi:CRP-like cAMP-binding protein